MKDWKTSLDRYLTNPPDDDGFESYFEAVAEAMPNDWWVKHNDWFINSDLCDQLISDAFQQGWDITDTVWQVEILKQVTNE